MTINHDSWLHLYGIFNGFFIAAVVYVLCFTFSLYIDKRQRHIAHVFLLSAVMLGAFSLYTLFYQFSYGAITVNAISPILFSIGKYTSPIAIMLITYLVVESSSYQSFRIVDFQRRYPFIVPIVYGMSAACLVLLFFIKNNVLANTVISIMFIPAILLGIFLVNIEFRNSPFRFVFIGLLMIALIADLTFIVSILPNNTEIAIHNHLALHMFYGTAVLLISFTISRYGFEEAKRFYDIKQHDTKNISSELYLALERGEFFLAYQPKLDITSNKVVGLEALIRWQHPNKGIIPPIEFIPIAEKTDMIQRICRWTIDQCVAQAHLLAQTGWHLPVAINFSTTNITPDIAQHLSASLKKHNLSPHLITIEITESVMMSVEHQVSKALTMFKELGVNLSLDDYGTGFSSLSYINHLSLSELKIDKSFVRDLEHNPTHRVIVESTLNMSHGLKLKVVAEGVENDAIRGILGDMGCDMVQGFGVYKPMTEEELVDWIKEQPTIFQKAS